MKQQFLKISGATDKKSDRLTCCWFESEHEKILNATRRNLEADDNREKPGIIHSFVWMIEKMLKTVEQKELRAVQWRLEENKGGELRFPHMWHSNASLVHESDINWEALKITGQINIMIYSNTNIILMLSSSFSDFLL